MISKINKTLQVTIPKQYYDYLDSLSHTTGDSKSKWICWCIVLLRDLQEGNISLVKDEKEGGKKNEVN